MLAGLKNAVRIMLSRVQGDIQYAINEEHQLGGGDYPGYEELARCQQAQCTPPNAKRTACSYRRGHSGAQGASTQETRESIRSEKNMPSGSKGGKRTKS